MMESGSVDLETAKEFNNGQTVPDMRVNGKTTEPMAKENSLISTEISTTETG
jgi:hypothetical protein